MTPLQKEDALPSAAESDLVRLVAAHYRHSEDEGRTLIQNALSAAADLDCSGEELHIALAPLSSPHRTRALAALCAQLNETSTTFPGTRLRLRFTVQPEPPSSMAFPRPAQPPSYPSTGHFPRGVGQEIWNRGRLPRDPYRAGPRREGEVSVGKSVRVAEGLFALTDAGPRLLGSTCRGCKASYFPRTNSCRNPACCGGELEAAEFGPRGTLWSYAVQNYAPPPPAKYDEPYAPYALGVVDLPGGIRVVGRMTRADPAALRIGAEVELVLEPLCRNADGDDLISWKFRPL